MLFSLSEIIGQLTFVQMCYLVSVKSLDSAYVCTNVLFSFSEIIGQLTFVQMCYLVSVKSLDSLRLYKCVIYCSTSGLSPVYVLHKAIFSRRLPDLSNKCVKFQ